jgi:hypothetical protein
MTPTPRLLAAAGQADITPERGIQIAGDIGRPRPVEEIRNRLHAKALVVESGGERACLISAARGSGRKKMLDMGCCRCFSYFACACHRK